MVARVFHEHRSIFQIHNSTERSVVLYSVNLMSTGRYRCEVSAEAPSFQTVSDHSDMLVVGKKIGRSYFPLALNRKSFFHPTQTSTVRWGDIYHFVPFNVQKKIRYILVCAGNFFFLLFLTLSCCLISKGISPVPIVNKIASCQTTRALYSWSGVKCLVK